MNFRQKSIYETASQNLQYFSPKKNKNLFWSKIEKISNNQIVSIIDQTEKGDKIWISVKK